MVQVRSRHYFLDYRVDYASAGRHGLRDSVPLPSLPYMVKPRHLLVVALPQESATLPVVASMATNGDVGRRTILVLLHHDWSRLHGCTAARVRVPPALFWVSLPRCPHCI